MECPKATVECPPLLCRSIKGKYSFSKYLPVIACLPSVSRLHVVEMLRMSRGTLLEETDVKSFFYGSDDGRLDDGRLFSVAMSALVAEC
jgi:hypothetical protein